MSSERWRMRHGPPFRPIRELDEVRRRIEEDIVRPVMRNIWEHIPEAEKGWAPAVDMFEKTDVFIVKVELPGVKSADTDVSVADDILVIKGERKPESGVKDEDYYRNEIPEGIFYRSLQLPSAVDTKNIEAVYEDGMLRITLPKAAGAKPRKVNITVKKEKD